MDFSCIHFLSLIGFEKSPSYAETAHSRIAGPSRIRLRPLLILSHAFCQKYGCIVKKNVGSYPTYGVLREKTVETALDGATHQVCQRERQRHHMLNRRKTLFLLY